MNVLMVCCLCTAKSFLRDYRWHLAFAVAAVVLGYLAGACLCGSSLVSLVADTTGLSAAAPAPPSSSAEYWHEIQKKVDQMARDLRVLQSYVNTGRQMFRVTDAAAKSTAR